MQMLKKETDANVITGPQWKIAPHFTTVLTNQCYGIVHFDGDTYHGIYDEISTHCHEGPLQLILAQVAAG